MATFSLDQLDVGRQGRIAKISAQPDVRHRLMEMGVLRGSVIRVVGRAPMGDPIDVEVRGYHLSLRKSEARFVQIETDDVSESSPDRSTSHTQ